MLGCIVPGFQTPVVWAWIWAGIQGSCVKINLDLEATAAWQHFSLSVKNRSTSSSLSSFPPCRSISQRIGSLFWYPQPIKRIHQMMNKQELSVSSVSYFSFKRDWHGPKIYTRMPFYGDTHRLMVAGIQSLPYISNSGTSDCPIKIVYHRFMALPGGAYGLVAYK